MKHSLACERYHNIKGEWQDGHTIIRYILIFYVINMLQHISSSNPKVSSVRQNNAVYRRWILTLPFFTHFRDDVHFRYRITSYDFWLSPISWSPRALVSTLSWLKLIHNAFNKQHSSSYNRRRLQYPELSFSLHPAVHGRHNVIIRCTWCSLWTGEKISTCGSIVTIQKKIESD
jgi:hypothetical protein